jgi:TolB-like protein
MRSIVLCVVVSAVFLISPPAVWSQEKIIIAVVDLKSLGLGRTAGETLQAELIGQSIAEAVLAELIRTGKFTALEKGALEGALAGQEPPMEGIIDGETIVKVGKLVGVKFMIVSSVSRSGDTYILSPRIVDVESGGIKLLRRVGAKLRAGHLR